MSKDIAIKVENVSKCYPIFEQPKDRLKQMILPRLFGAHGEERRRYYREFWALSGVSFQLKKGETLGVIGRNGSGKSTLLQIVCGTLAPTTGAVEANGRIAALLELGSSFNPDFTGRENVYLNASLLGLSSSEVDSRFAAIEEFADIGSFIDQPVRTYSSGMQVRLAFAVQAQVSPDILVVDEALAVGDAKFQVKCFERLKQLKEGGTSILLVTHSSEQIVMHCTQAILLDKGSILQAGQPREVVNTYLDLLFGKQRKANPPAPGKSVTTFSPSTAKVSSSQLNFRDDAFAARPGYNRNEYRWGDGAARILDFYLEADGEPFPSSIASGQEVRISVSVAFHETLVRPIFGLTLKTKEGITVYGANSESIEEHRLKDLGSAGQCALINASFICRLAPGDYFVCLGVATRHGEEITPHDRRYDSIHLQVRPTGSFFGLADLNLTLDVQEVGL
jgi:lipopolysaccharide transport system ATP-binding protein